MHGWVAGDVAKEGLASDIQGLFPFQRVHVGNIANQSWERHWEGERD